MKFLSRYLPLIYFIFLAGFWFADNYIELGIINYMAIAVVLVLVSQLFANNILLGLGIGSAGILFCGYRLVLAAIGFSQSAGSSALPFFLIMLVIFGTGLALGALLVIWYRRQKATPPARM